MVVRVLADERPMWGDALTEGDDRGGDLQRGATTKSVLRSIHWRLRFLGWVGESRVAIPTFSRDPPVVSKDHLRGLVVWSTRERVNVSD